MPRPFDVDEVFRRLRRAVGDVPKAAVFDLRDRGRGSPFEVLAASLISARTRDETTPDVGLRLFARAPTPAALLALDVPELAGLLSGVTFAQARARDLRGTARELVDRFGGVVPDTMEGLTSFRGVGPRIAALTLAVAFGRAAVAVDIHVHRVTNRWDNVITSTPEQTMTALGAKLPREDRVEINERLVPFGKHVCTGVRPKCPTCPVREFCARVGVTGARGGPP